MILEMWIGSVPRVWPKGTKIIKTSKRKRKRRKVKRRQNNLETIPDFEICNFV